MSSRDMTLTEFKNTTKAFDDSHTVKVKDLKTGGGTRKPRNNQIPSWFKKFHKEEFKPLQEAVIKLQTEPPKYFIDFVNEQREFNKLLLSRIDKLENLVVTQFKQHKWIK